MDSHSNFVPICGSCKTVKTLNTCFSGTANTRILDQSVLVRAVSLAIVGEGGGGKTGEAGLCRIFWLSFVLVLHTSGQTMLMYI